jgi:Protein of unknown function (DUF1360)
MLGALSVWRLTHLLYAEDGPWDLLVRLRSRAGHGIWGGLLDCFYCLSLWMAVPFAVLIGGNWRERILLSLALSGAAILMERITSRDQDGSRVHYFEDKEESDVVLRTEKGNTPGKDVREVF